MSLVDDVKKLIMNSTELRAYVELENICSFNLPKELIDKTDRTVLLVQSTGSKRGGYAGDYSTKKFETCEIQVWFVIGSDTESHENMEKELVRLLERNKIFNRQSTGLDIDPDTDQLYLTLEFWRDKGEIY